MLEFRAGKVVISPILVLVGLVLVAIGLALLAGGVALLMVGGSAYYALAGFGLALAGVLIGLRRMAGVYAFWAVFVGSVIWAVWEAGFAFWPQVPRLLSPVVIGIVVAIVTPLLPKSRTIPQLKLMTFSAAGILTAVAAAFLVGMWFPHGVTVGRPDAAAVRQTGPATATTWQNFGNSPGGTRFVNASQINTESVKGLKVAWTFRTGLPPEGDSAEQNTPLQIDDTLYLCTSTNVVIALDAENGAERWRYDPKIRPQWFSRCRGLGYFAPEPAAAAAPSQNGPALCSRRIVLTTVDGRLIELDAANGRPCADFGDKGQVDLKVGLGDFPPEFWYVTSGPTVARGMIVVGGYQLDNQSTDQPSGVVRGFDARTGVLVWAWDVGNPNGPAAPAAGDRYTPGTPNVWGFPSVDPVLGLVYLPTGAATPDFWGGRRSKAQDKYASSVVAVDIMTGKERWSFQTVRHDIWDYDVASQPVLYDIPDGEGGSIPALVQLTKRGQIFLLNRETGAPLAKVVERRVAQKPSAGDFNAPTQPYSTGLPSVGAQPLTEARMWGATPLDQLWCRLQFRKSRYDGEFTPPNVDISLQYPGQGGGMNWGSGSVDERRGYLIVNDIRLAYQLQLVPRDETDRRISARPNGPFDPHDPLAPQRGTPFGAIRTMFLSPLGFPCNQPPYGSMTAIDLKSRQVVWQRPMGTLRDTGPMGIKGLAFPIGMPTLGGSVTTSGGLVFFAGTRDYTLRAVSASTGQDLWAARLPVGSTATPISYISPKSGRQFVAILAGGAPGAERGDYLIAYALPGAQKGSAAPAGG